MSNNSHYILERFPDQRDVLALLIATDPDFLALSEEYDACIQAKCYWARSAKPEAEARVHEYRILVEELEEEIVEVLAPLIPHGHKSAFGTK
jgi:hypothetical protein